MLIWLIFHCVLEPDCCVQHGCSVSMHASQGASCPESFEIICHATFSQALFMLLCRYMYSQASNEFNLFLDTSVRGGSKAVSCLHARNAYHVVHASSKSMQP